MYKLVEKKQKIPKNLQDCKLESGAGVSVRSEISAAYCFVRDVNKREERVEKKELGATKAAAACVDPQVFFQHANFSRLQNPSEISSF